MRNKSVLRANNELTNLPVGMKEASSIGLANFVSARPPTGNYISRLKKFSQQMKLHLTPAEKELYIFLKQNNIPFKYQVIIAPYIVDFLLAEKGLIIELDGQHHSQNLNQMTYDTKRDELLMSLKLTVIRFNNENLNLNQILKIYNDRPTFNRERIFFRLGHHNHHYEEKGFDTLTGSYFKKYFAQSLKIQLNKVLRRYKFNLKNQVIKIASIFLILFLINAPKAVAGEFSIDKLKGVKPELVQKIILLKKLANQKHIDFIITCGYRSQAEQDKLYAQGRTTSGKKVTWTRHSKHTQRIAVDIAIMKNGKISWKPEDYFEIGLLAQKIDLTWGGSWKVKDYCHLEL